MILSSFLSMVITIITYGSVEVARLGVTFQ